MIPFAVVWNPWQAKAAAMRDLGKASYPHMVCVEAGFVSSPYTLQPGAMFEASQTLQA
jgi:glucose-6-phosphate 1-epimerase